jgi:hypothetical protein
MIQLSIDSRCTCRVDSRALIGTRVQGTASGCLGFNFRVRPPKIERGNNNNRQWEMLPLTGLLVTTRRCQSTESYVMGGDSIL